MSRPRMTVFRCLVLVAVVAVGLAVVRERQLRFRRLAGDYQRRAMAAGFAEIPVNTGKTPRMAVVRKGRILDDGPDTERLKRRYWWLREMGARYERAAQSPWLPVICPPEPE